MSLGYSLSCLLTFIKSDKTDKISITKLLQHLDVQGLQQPRVQHLVLLLVLVVLCSDEFFLFDADF